MRYPLGHVHLTFPYRPKNASLLTALVVGGLMFAAPAAAQSLPDWAEPSVPSSAPAPIADMAPEPPSAPAPVPIDGGLGLLALAGGAYAAKRLRARRSS